MKIYIPTPLRSYTERQSSVEVDGATLVEAMAELERRCPGIRFRIIDEQDQIREHIRIFVNEARAPDLNVPLQASDRVQIILAISGG
jgi:sulfur-carrier protein